MKERLQHAVVDGLVLGVKYAIAAIAVAVVLLAVVGDYQITRSRAENGQRAWQVIELAQQRPTSSTNQTPAAPAR